LARRRALVVLDGEIEREMLQALLADWGIRGEAASSEAEALAKLRTALAAKDPFEAALVRVGRPALDGLALARVIRADPEVGSLGLVLLAGHRHRPDPAAVTALGRAVCVSRPPKARALREALVSLVSGAVPAVKAVLTGTPAGSEATPGVQGPAKRSFKILVAEDNLVNQKVTSLQLSRLGFEADIASNGLQAVEMWQAGSHPLILMDCQMPEMDGFAASRKIRELERATGAAPVRIIAMTASAIVGDRELCMEAQMDDYITKPVALNRLKETIERNLASQERV
jgi:CheY-like chemotaxis protein